jgi:prefoldin subunit 5
MDARGPLQSLQELEAQHDELLRELDALDQRICQVLQECTSHDEEKTEPVRETSAAENTVPEVLSAP